MNYLFLDTSYIVALELSDDQNHLATLEHWRDLDKNGLCLVTSSYVFDEVVTFLSSRGFRSKANDVGRSLLTSKAIKLIHVDEELFGEGWEYFQKYQDKSYSLTDCLSFIIMKQFKIKLALTYDQHFVQAGFTRLP